MKVAVGASSFDEQGLGLEKMLQERDILLVKNPYGRKLTKEETIAHLQGATGLLAGLEPLDGDVFEACPDLKVISRIGIGMDNVDLEAAKKHGILVSNTPEGPTAAVAEMTLTALLAITHHIIQSNDDMHNGIWEKRNGRALSELKVLIIGYGHIGKKTAGLLKGLGAELLIYDKYNPQESTCELEEGLRHAEVISMHASGTDRIIGKEEFSFMQDGAIILNSARGGLIDEQALCEALQSGKVSAFWGDAFWEEPYHGVLTTCENAILTPHISTYTRSCREKMERQAVENLLRDLKRL